MKPEENGSFIPLTLPQPIDTVRIPKAYDQGKTKKVTWGEMAEEQANGQGDKAYNTLCNFYR